MNTLATRVEEMERRDDGRIGVPETKRIPRIGRDHKPINIWLEPALLRHVERVVTALARGLGR